MKAEVKFKIKAFTRLNQNIRLLGDIEELGSWTPSEAYQLYTNERIYPNWVNIHPLRVPMGEKFEFKFAVFENGVLQSWEDLPENRNRRYTPFYGRVQLRGIFSELEGQEIIEKRIPSFSNLKVQINTGTIRRLKLSRLRLRTDSSADSSYISDESNIFSEWGYISQTISQSEEEDKSDDLSENLGEPGSRSGLDFQDKNTLIQVEFSPIYNPEATIHEARKKAAIQKITSQANFSGLQSFYLRRKLNKTLFSSPNSIKIDEGFREAALASRKDEYRPNEKRLLICSLFLPLKVEVLGQNSSDRGFQVSIENREFRASLLADLLASEMEFLWIGILRISETSLPFDQRENMRVYLRNAYKCVAIFLDSCDLEAIEGGFFEDYFNRFLCYANDEFSTDPKEFDPACYRALKDLISCYGFEVSATLEHFPNPAVYILDYRLFLLSESLRNSNETSMIALSWEMPFLSEEDFIAFPLGNDLIKALGNCNLLIFPTFEEAKRVFSISRRFLGFEFSSHKGTFYLDFPGRIITVRVSPTLMNLKKLGESSNCWQNDFSGFEVICTFESARTVAAEKLDLKMRLVEKLTIFRRKNKGKLLKLMVLSSGEIGKKARLEIQKLVDSMNRRLNYECVLLQETKLPESLEDTLLSETHFLLETEITEKSWTNVQRFLYFSKSKGTVLVPTSLKPWVSSLTTSFLDFSLINPEEAFQKASEQKPAGPDLPDPKSHPSKGPLAWLESSFEDFLLNPPLKTLSNRNESFNCKKHTLKGLKPKPDFVEISLAARQKPNKLLIFGVEGVFYDPEKPDSLSSLSVLEELELLASSNPGMTVYLLSGLSLSSLPPFFFGFPNLGFLNEFGFLHKEPSAQVWLRLFKYDWEWKEVVEKIMQVYVNKTPGSRIDSCESCVSWSFELSEAESGGVQCRELINHLTESFLIPNPEFECLRLEKTVSVRVSGMNKGTAGQLLLERFVRDHGKIGFLGIIGGVSEDNDLFQAVNELRQESFADYFTEECGFFQCGINGNCSLAESRLKGEEDLLRLIDALGEETVLI